MIPTAKIDELIINNKRYDIPETASLLSIAKIKEIDILIPKGSFYHTQKNFIYDNDFAIKAIGIISNVPESVLKLCTNVEDVFMRFYNRIIFSIYYPNVTELKYRKYYPPADIYETESIYPFAEACDLLSDFKNLQSIEYLPAIYMRQKNEDYSLAVTRSRLEMFNYYPYSAYLQCLATHNEASAKVRQYHPKLFGGDGKSKSMNDMIAFVAGKGVFKSGNLSALESTRKIKVSEFFDYLESAIYL